MSVGLIYRYFPSKEELFLELFISGTPEELTHLAERIAPIEDPVERLTVAIDSYFDALFHASGTPLVLQALVAVAEQGGDLDRDGVRDRVVRTVIAASGLHPAAR